MTAMNHLELLTIAESVAREKGIDYELVIKAIQEAIERAARFRFGTETQVKAGIDLKTGAVSLVRMRTIVEHVEKPATEISLEEALEKEPTAALGGVIEEALPWVDFTSVAAQSGRQIILQRIREAERLQQYEEYKDRCGEIINGVVKRIEYRNVIVGLAYGEGMIRREELIPREVFHVGDRVRAYLYEVKPETHGPQIFLSRAHPQFLAKLFAQEVPEVYEGVVKICAIARDPGSRAKVGVMSDDTSIDPVGACVGLRGSRVQAVISELRGEKIDIVPWSSDHVTCIVNALQPAEVEKVVLDEEAHRMLVVMPADQLSLAIGRRGQNVRLASQLTDWSIDIVSEEEDSEIRQKEFTQNTEKLVKALNVDELIAQLLVSEGFVSVEDILDVPAEELAQIEGFDAETAEELQTRAQDFLDEEKERQKQECLELGIAEDLMALEDVTLPFILRLGKEGILTLDDFAGCTADDLVGWTERKGRQTISHPGFFAKTDLSREAAEALILSARVALGWIAPEEAPKETEATESVEVKKAPSTLDELDALFKKSKKEDDAQKGS